MSTTTTRSPLARHHGFRPVRFSTEALDRLTYITRRDAFVAVFANAPTKSRELIELTRSQPRCALPDEKQRRMIHTGIRAGYVTREQCVRFRLAQLIDDLGQFPAEGSAHETLYRLLMKETGEMVDWQTIARGTPTTENRARAVQETRENIAIEELQIAAMEHGAIERYRESRAKQQEQGAVQ
jgi:hypothetical protein